MDNRVEIFLASVRFPPRMPKRVCSCLLSVGKWKCNSVTEAHRDKKEELQLDASRPRAGALATPLVHFVNSRSLALRNTACSSADRDYVFSQMGDRQTEIIMMSLFLDSQ